MPKKLSNRQLATKAMAQTKATKKTTRKKGQKRADFSELSHALSVVRRSAQMIADAGVQVKTGGACATKKPRKAKPAASPVVAKKARKKRAKKKATKRKPARK